MFLYSNNTAAEQKSQVDKAEILVDKSATGRERPWREKKMANQLLALAYDKVNEKKASRLRECGTFLAFNLREDGTKKLTHMNSCRVRLCPLCAWRRSLKVHAHTVQILDAMQGEYAYVFLTLTVRNCAGNQLASELDKLMAAWQRLTQRKAFRVAVKGWYRGLEVTHNVNPLSASYDTFHPHFHCLLAVNKSYFTSRDYLSQPKWRALWRKAARLNYDPQVDVRRVKADKVDGVCAEVAKYAVKVSDVICFDDWDLTVDTVATLDKALDKRRFISFGGVFKEIHKQLNLDDVEQGDLVHENDSELPDVSKDTVLYAWNTGYNQYVRSK